MQSAPAFSACSSRSPAAFHGRERVGQFSTLLESARLENTTPWRIPPAGNADASIAMRPSARGRGAHRFPKCSATACAEEPASATAWRSKCAETPSRSSQSSISTGSLTLMSVGAREMARAGRRGDRA